jgi:hypothetical protein
MKEENGYKIYTAEELAQILKEHAEFLINNERGKRANLSYANLSFADLSSANLLAANLSSANLSSANLSSANLSSANLSYANLRYANLSSANLSYANLRYADLDYSCFPLWCGGAYFKCSAKLLYQLLAHVYTLEPLEKKEQEEFDSIKKAIEKFALKSHRASDLKIVGRGK